MRFHSSYLGSMHLGSMHFDMFLRYYVWLVGSEALRARIPVTDSLLYSRFDDDFLNMMSISIIVSFIDSTLVNRGLV